MDTEKKESTMVEDAKTEALPAEQPKKSERPWKKTRAWQIAKWSLWVFGGLFAIAILALLSLPLWINPVATSLANMLVPKYTGTAFNIERVNLNPYTGKLFISGVKLANPEGYSEKEAFALGSLSADVEVSTLLSDTIHVREITIDSPFASYVFDAEGVNNFARIMEAVNKKLGPKKEEKEKGETKVVIDKVTVRNVRAAVGNGMFELESLTLTDFGKDTPAQIELSGARLVNPEGFPEPNAFSLKALSIGMETADLSKKPIVFHDIAVDTPYLGLGFNKEWTCNLTTIFKPLTANKKKGGEKEDAAEENKSGNDGARVVIDKLAISDLKIGISTAGTLPLGIPLPDFSLPSLTFSIDDIGKESEEGSGLRETIAKVKDKVLQGVGAVGSLISGIVDRIVQLKDGDMVDLFVSYAKKSIGGAIDGIKDKGGAVIDGIKDKGGAMIDGIKSVLPGGAKKE